MQARIAAVTRVGAFMLLVLAANAFAADAKSAVGSWILNPTKSSFQNMPAPGLERLRILKDGDNSLAWRLSGFGPDGRAFHQEYDGPTDGSFHDLTGGQNPGTAAYTRAGAVTSWIVKDTNGAIVEKGTFSLSPDGLTLALKGTRTTPQGESSYTRVYDRVQ
jgi:hypothetical protein